MVTSFWTLLPLDSFYFSKGFVNRYVDRYAERYATLELCIFTSTHNGQVEPTVRAHHFGMNRWYLNFSIEPYPPPLFYRGHPEPN